MLAISMFLLAGGSAAYAAKKVKVPMSLVSADGVGKAVGTITLQDSKDGVTITTDLKDLPPGEHGFHMHEKPSCDPADKDGKKTAAQAAGGHFDPDTTKADMEGHSLMIHEGGDNYSDAPKPLGGGGSRMACGVIPAAAAK